jgi:hypothetical protein
MNEKPARLPEALVQEFVAVAHGDRERVQALLIEEPRLIHATWDWGGGDFETALGAAAHKGRRDIAEFLLGHGAHLDLFAAAMLNLLPVVEAHLTALPQAAQALGPHGSSLLAHAQAGEAEDVVRYLEKCKI